MKNKGVNILAFLMIFSLLFPHAIFARTIICESVDNRHNYCRIKNNGNIRIINHLSSAGCIRGHNWGYDRNGIWVDGGCRAEFEVGFDDYDYSWGESGFSICESQDYGYRYCPSYTREGVKLFRQLSNEDCIKGRTWGYDRNGIWVDGGCRAEFNLNIGGSGRRHRDWHKHTHDDTDELAAAIGIIGGLALLGAIIGSNENNPSFQSSPPYYYNEPYAQGTNSIPYWIIGIFKGYSVFYKAEIEINISPNGIINAFLWDTKLYGVYNKGELIIDSMTYNIEYLSDGFIAKQRGNHNNQIYFKKLSNL